MTTARVLLITAVWLWSSGLIAQQTQANKTASATAVEQQITSTLHQMYEAEKRRDLKFVLAHLADDFAEVSGDGKIYHRSDLEAGWNDVHLTDYKLSDCVFQLLTADVAYQSCGMEVDATYKDQSFPRRVRTTWVWTRQQGAWLIRFEQGTIIPDQAKKE